MVGTILGLGTGFMSSGINAAWTKQLNEQNAMLNDYYWNKQSNKLFNQNEKAAENAMQRSIDLYNKLQSPASMVEQLKKAGLNPALMYSNGGMGGRTMNGPQGGAQNGQGAPTLGLQNLSLIDPLTMAQIRNIDADTAKKEEEVKNIQEDTLLKQADKLLKVQLHDQTAQKFVHELAILAATEAITNSNKKIAENDSSDAVLNNKNEIQSKQLEILKDEAELKKMEAEFQKAFKEKYGIDLSSMDGLSSTIIQLLVRLGEKGQELIQNWEIELPRLKLFRK